MARTAPAPDIPPIPGMCPSIAVLAGGGDAGGGGGGGAGEGDGKTGAGAGSGGENAEGDGRGAPDYQKHPECGYASHPVDVVTGRAFTHPIADLDLPGPLPLTFRRTYSSKAAHIDMGLGFGWAHTFGWKVEVKRRSIVVWNEQGIAVDFPMIRPGDEALGPWGWVIRRETWGFAVDADDGLWHLFSEPDPKNPGFYLLTAVEDRNRNRIALTWDDDKLVEVKDSAGRVIKLVPTREGRIGSIQVQNAVSQGQWIAFATYTYDEHGNLASVTDADGYASHYEYDEDHRLTLDQDRAGLAFHFVYDTKGRCVESWGDYPGRRDPSLGEERLPAYLADDKTRAKGIHHCKLDYGSNGYTEVADATEVRRYFGNARGTLDKRVEGGAVVTAQYDAEGHLLSRTGPLGDTTSYTRDARGRLLRLTDPLGRVTSIERDSLGLMTSFTLPNGGVRTYVRDRFGNITLATNEVGATTSYQYDSRGLCTDEVSPDGHKTRYEYDAQGNMTAVTRPNGAVYRYTYDGLGRAISETDPLGATSRYAYSNRGDLVAKYDAAGATRYSWDGERHLTSVVSPAGRRREMVWGGYHKLCAIHDADDQWVRLRYNTDGAPVEIRNERGEAHRYAYKPSGMMVEETTFDGVRTVFKYDLAGELTETIDAGGQKTVRVRNLAGEIVERHLADGVVETYEHDALGDVVRAVSGAVEVCFERDLGGRVIRETTIIGDETHTIEHTYDLAGRRTARRTSRGHADERRVDHATGMQRVLLDGHVELGRELDALGRERARLLPEGGRIESEFDPRGQLVRRSAFGRAGGRAMRPDEPQWIGNRSDGKTFERSYGYDPDGLLMEEHDDRGQTRRFERDPLGQLLAVIPDRARGEVYRIDATGNLHEHGSDGPVPTSFGPGNRLLRKGDTIYEWNSLGQLVTKSARAPDGRDQVFRYTWTGGGLLGTVTTPDETLIEFEYDAFDRRVGKRVSRLAGAPGGPLFISFTRFVWDNNRLVHEIKRSAAAAGDPVVEERTYCFDDGESFAPIAHRELRRRGDAVTEDAWYHYVNDPAGTPERLIGADGSVIGEIRRTMWGRTEMAEGSRATTPLRFPGQIEDEETGLHYNRFRYYDPETGQYISADPIGVSGGLNLFRYVEDPFGMTDPFGLAGRCTCTIKLKEPVGGTKTYSGTSGSTAGHHPIVQDALDRVDKPGGKKEPSHAKGACGEPRALTNYLNAWEKEKGPINSRDDLLKALKNIDSIDPYDNDLKSRKKMCGWCQAMMPKLGGTAAGMSDKVKKKGAVD